MASNTEKHPGWVTKTRLWLVLDHEACAPRAVSEVCSSALAGGVDAVLCRLRNLDRQTRMALATEAREVCSTRSVPFVVSHDVELARECRADGVQFGTADGEFSQFSELAGEGMPWGYSSHSIVEADAAMRAGASWVFLGPVFETAEKIRYGAPLGIATAATAIKQPWNENLILIGGINSSTLPALANAGARRIAAISALQRVADPAEAAMELLAIMQSAQSGPGS